MGEKAAHLSRVTLNKRLSFVRLSTSCDLASICIIERHLVQELVVQLSLAQGCDDLLFNLIHVVDEGIVSEALECALLD